MDENWVKFPNAEYVKHFKKKKRDKADYPSPDECVLEMVNYQLKVCVCMSHNTTKPTK